MVSADYPSAVRAGAMAAARLHQRLNLRAAIEEQGGNVDIFHVYQRLHLPVLIRPLEGLLGAYVRDPIPGVLITTERPMSIQRWTAAHELGHHYLEHHPSLDNESVLRRMPIDEPPMGGDFQEDEANSFATSFLMPRWLIAWHCQRQSWEFGALQRPENVYQLSLRLGTSYEATCWTLARANYIDRDTAYRLVDVEPKSLKVALLGTHRPKDYKGDVWLLTERDAGTRIDGSKNDAFVLRLPERAGAGYLWNIDNLKESGFAIVKNETEALDDESVGGPIIRRITAASPEGHRGRMSIEESLPWDPDDTIAQLTVDYDFTGPEIGLSRAEKRRVLAAA